jgi:hypothetical protein
MGTKGVPTCERSPFLVGSCAGTRDICPALSALVDPVQNINFLTVHYFTSFVPIARQAGQAVVPRRLFFQTCYWVECKGPVILPFTL